MSILRLTVSNDKAELPRVNFALMEFLHDDGVPPEVVHRVRLVVEELVVNVIQHGFDNGAKHAILLDVRTEPRRVVIVVEDDGKPFDPSPQPGGLAAARPGARDREARRAGRHHRPQIDARSRIRTDRR
jgi:anti-sigma regulatory factor (Ser/Thr protein kinase)